MSLAGDLRFQDFEIVKTLGKGAAGIAELARQKADGQLICLKVIEGAAVNASQNQEVLAEIKVLEKLQHTHVIAYIGCFEHASALYVAMEYAEGGDLEKLWQDAQKRKRAFEEERVLEWGHQISQDLQYVHSMKVRLSSRLLCLKAAGLAYLCLWSCQLSHSWRSGAASRSETGQRAAR